MAKSQTDAVSTPPKPPKSRRNQREDGVPKVLPFFERVGSIAKADWGTRAQIKVYRMEPVINQLAVAENKYIAIYGEDGYAVNEEKIKQDHGSGRYRLYLNYKAPGEGEGKELDSLVLDILDYDYPPRMLAGVWLDHPRNRNWAWAKEKILAQQPPAPVIPPAPTPLGEVAQTLGVLSQIQDDAVARAKASVPAQQPQLNMLDLLRGVKELMPAPQPGTENAILQTVLAMTNTQIESMRAEARELRQEIRDMRNNPGEKKNAMDLFKDGLEMFKGIAPTIKEIFPGLKDAATTAVGGRSRMGPWQEFLVQFGQPILSDVINSPVATAFGQMMLMKAQQTGVPAPNGTASVAHPNPAIASAQPKSLVDFFNVVWPSMLRYLKEDWAGDEFAAWLMDGYGCPYNGLDWRGQAQLVGGAQIVAAFKSSPFWQQIAVLPNGEQKFTEFVDAFVAWDPSAGDQQDNIPDGEVIDLTAEEQNAHV